ncbi:CoA transferase [Parasphingopyxis algicola]|uniref:CaiB/BaiF CoA transferase family protein n=1 Tax=Parasphingopyxis algicola TaxID=2026624 RepID=UPI0015A2256B|nr:CaiB/BaiF CoA-transferase family protein [Parasphingopyxis algicola]QLC26145.1 CoA transferase [Parasphingopyxis algicola]
MTAKALSDVRVLDLSRVLAGPWATQMLGDLGAEIIKIEKPGFGDDTRGWGPPWHGNGEQRTAGYYLAANRNKKSVAIDIAKAEGQQLIRDLAAESDIVVENFKRGGLARYGLDYPRLKAINPKLIYCSITGFGQDGPDADKPGYDLMIQAMSGFMSITGNAEGPPRRMGVAMVDLTTGMNAAAAILAALYQRERTGEGQHIDIALFDVALSSLGNQALNYLVSGEAPVRTGNAHPNVVPYQPFETADGWIIVAVGNDNQFARFAALLGHADMAEDERYCTNGARVENRDTLIPPLAAAMKARTTAEWTAALIAANVPYGPINTIEEAFAEPQAVHRGLSRTIDGVPQVASPLRLGASPMDDATPPPALGQDTDAVLEDRLGLSAEECAKLRDNDVLG